MSGKNVYKFGDSRAEGKADMKLLLGGKGANLAEMSNLGIPVPAGFTISTDICTEFYKNKGTYTQEVINEIKEGMAHIEKIMGAKFGDPKNPLLVSVRSGAPASMPGMMDTVLNLGLNDATVQGLIDNSKNERFGWDSFRRFVQMYGDVVLGMKPQSKEEEDPFEIIIHELKQKRGVKLDTELTAAPFSSVNFPMTIPLSDTFCPLGVVVGVLVGVVVVLLPLLSPPPPQPQIIEMAKINPQIRLRPAIFFSIIFSWFPFFFFGFIQTDVFVK